MLSRGELPSAVGKRMASKYFKSRYNCAQSVILAAAKACKMKPPEELVRSTRVFGGGIGYSGCLCGALAGALLTIGYLCSKPEKRAGEFIKIFIETFGSSCCRTLRKGMDYKNPELKRHCAMITEETASLLIDFVREKGI